MEEIETNILKKPFVNYTLEENKQETGSEVISLKLNKEERALIEDLKRLTNYSQDSKVIKIGLKVLKNVILGTFGAELFIKITGSERRRAIFEDQPPRI